MAYHDGNHTTYHTTDARIGTASIDERARVLYIVKTSVRRYMQ